MTACLTLYLKRTRIEHFELAAVAFDLPGRIQRTAKAKLAGAWSGMLQGHREGGEPPRARRAPTLGAPAASRVRSRPPTAIAADI
jgi:hypothetical protein